jgi:hypothetical protein
MATQAQATLNFGSLYVYNKKSFKKGVAVNVTADEQAYLSANGVYVNRLGSDNETRCRFTFSEITVPDAPAPTPVPTPTPTKVAPTPTPAPESK